MGPNPDRAPTRTGPQPGPGPGEGPDWVRIEAKMDFDLFGFPFFIKYWIGTDCYLSQGDGSTNLLKA